MHSARHSNVMGRRRASHSRISRCVEMLKYKMFNQKIKGSKTCAFKHVMVFSEDSGEYMRSVILFLENRDHLYNERSKIINIRVRFFIIVKICANKKA